MKPNKYPGVSIFKRKSRSGDRDSHLIAFKENGRRRVISASPDAKAADLLAQKISRGLELKRLGIVAERDLRYAQHALVPLCPAEPQLSRETPAQTHLEIYLELLRARRRDRQYVQMVGSRIALLFDRADFRVIDDIECEKLELAIGSLADEREWTDQTTHHYLDAAKQFTRWLRKSGRARFDELEQMPPIAVVDVLRRRRPLDEKQIAKLLAAAAAGEDYIWWGSRVMSGEQRELAYILALESGLRANEERTLRPESFHLDPEPGKGRPYVVVEGRDSKHRWLDEVLLRDDTAQRFRHYLSGRPAGKAIWDFPDKPAEMLKIDLAKAAIPYQSLYGVADYHALRHTFCCRTAEVVAKLRLSPKTCQEMMRHSDVRMTIRYMHATLHDHATALANLPAIGRRLQRQKATGTDGLPFQRPVQRQAFPPVPADSHPFPMIVPQNGPQSPRQAVDAASAPQMLLFPAITPQSSEPRVAGSSPAGCVDPSHDPATSNDAELTAGPADPQPGAAPGTAPPDEEAQPLEHYTLEEIQALLSELRARQRGGAS